MYLKDLFDIPMIPKKDFGSIPLAVLKSVPVYRSDLIASRTPCTIATQDTKENTVGEIRMRSNAYKIIVLLTDNFGTHGFCLRGRERWCQAA